MSDKLKEKYEELKRKKQKAATAEVVLLMPGFLNTSFAEETQCGQNQSNSCQGETENCNQAKETDHPEGETQRARQPSNPFHESAFETGYIHDFAAIERFTAVESRRVREDTRWQSRPNSIS